MRWYCKLLIDATAFVAREFYLGSLAETQLFTHSYTAFDSEIAFAILLGPTDPCSIAVSMEPFSTLALKGLT